MKVVGLNRMREVEDKLKDKFPDVSFKFYKKAIDIPLEDKRELDILVGYDSKVDESFLKSCPNLKWLAWFATGVNNLPLQYIKDNNILLTNGRGVQAKQLSEYILAFILDDYKKMPLSYENQRKHIYDSTITGKRLAHNTLLFLGTGAIAQRTAKLAQAFNMKVIGMSKSGQLKDNFDEIYKISALNDLLPQADIVINALPETTETIHLLHRKHFEIMKDEALFINIGRGSIVKEELIIEVLREKIIRHAYLDVFEHEPLSSDSPLYELDNVTITAHITGNDYNAKYDLLDIFTNNLSSFLTKGELNENIVEADKGY
ncbi:phosphoglycerate dehydrogenase [Staphylococcus simiae]|uniref:phosphoglycerate dehydrogenase n=1 Tax=Staphylococcus simiae TaxID=308354 RepID=UPI001A9660BE|nr:phosphoglycerate dehydrogenase [Staphylococcus simiae]MBO1199810.1 phosphoglycerate dehydrogenase [Staphylococcus simiae]MBO1202075.1 phosphoglycerate dehydrogenase [Staphylococcus simiae]MBO1204333.1 phosphoglycerate dehydrogenase [Staphylococcus simiae]MBO1211854.1 phosphoglycerate dehydrogenase [Staphylococcus simiae]MBO1230500.1 phosphoglycerate dehydrogenase [Staphylococcus simiae]